MAEKSTGGTRANTQSNRHPQNSFYAISFVEQEFQSEIDLRVGLLFVAGYHEFYDLRICWKLCDGQKKEGYGASVSSLSFMENEK